MDSVLLVEDNPAVRGMIADYLHGSGYRVLQAETGEQALAAAWLCGGVDLLLSDLRLPDVDGLELAQRVTAASPGARVILMTGSTAAEVEGRPCPRLAAVLEKPFSLRALAHAVETALAAAPAAPAA